MAATKYIRGQAYVLTSGKHHRTERKAITDDKGNVRSVRTQRETVTAGQPFTPSEKEWEQNKDRLAYAPTSAPDEIDSGDEDDGDEDDGGDDGDKDLPFKPRSVAVDDLPDVLSSIDDAGVISKLQDADTRVTAAGHYERRLNELQGGGA